MDKKEKIEKMLESINNIVSLTHCARADIRSILNTYFDQPQEEIEKIVDFDKLSLENRIVELLVKSNEHTIAINKLNICK